MFQEVKFTNVTGIDLTGVEQLTDAFFIVMQFLCQDSSLCRSLESLSLVGCTHITDLSIVYITQFFPSLKQAILCNFYPVDCCSGIVKEGCIPEDWKSSVVLPVYKGKGDTMECGSYRGIKLLEHAMKVVERIFEHRILQQIDIDDKQFGLMNGK